MQGIKFVFDLEQVIGFCALITGIWGGLEDCERNQETV